MFSVLYVDDEPGLLEIGKVFLESYGDFSVATIESAPAALALLQTARFDAIISDYLMPVMDGLEFLKQVRLLHGHIPFILFTGRGREEVVINALNLGADFYLQKGGDPQAQFTELAHKIRQAVRRRRMETALEESESRYRAVIESQTELICRFRPDGTLIFVNRAFCTYYGKTSEELIGNRLRYEIHPDEREANRQHFAALTPENPVGTIEHRVLMPDGSVRWQQWTDRALFNGEGQLEEYQSVGRDITDRHLAEEATEASENLYRTVFTTTGAATIIIAPDTTILLANTGWERLTGIPRADQENKLSWTVFFNREDTDRMVRYHHDRRKDPSLAPDMYETRLIDAQKKVHYCYVHVHMIPGTQNSVASLVDITAQKMTEESLRESEEKFRVMADNLPIAIVVYQDNRVIYVNDFSAEISGYSKEELYAKDFWDIFAPGCRDLVRERGFARQKGETVPDRYEIQIVNRQGETRWAYLTAGKILIGGKTAGIATIEDITDRKKVEESLRESEEKFRALAEHAPVAIGVIQDNRYVYMNEFLVRAMGYTRAEMAAMDYWVHVRKDQQEKIIEDGRAWARGEPGPWMNEIEYYTRSGETRWAVSSSAHIMYGGRHAGIVTLVGITDRKRAENELRAAYDQLAAVNAELKEQYARAEEGRKRLQQSERDYRSIIDNLQDAFYRTDPAGNLTMISPSFVRQMGYEDEQEILGKNVRDQFYVDPRDRDPFLQELERTGTVQEHRVTLRRRDGSTVVFMASSRLIRDDAGRPAGVEGILHDMTRIDGAEEARRESEAKYRLLADHVHDVIWTAGMDMRLTYISPSITGLRGLTPEEALAEDVRTALTPASYATIMQLREKALPGLVNGGPVQEYQSMDLEFYKKDGSTVWTETVISPVFDRDGAPRGVVGVMRDITKRKQAEDALRMANRKLNLLTGITRHDIRNQLLVLKGYVRLVEKDITDPLLTVFCHKATESAERISSMIQFTREYEELGTAPPAWQAVRPLLDAAILQAPAGPVALVNTIPDSLEVLADPLIVKVFYNLIDNALRHGETVTTIRFSSDERHDGLVIVCEDDGSGVPAGEKDLIFERGFGRNSGLGLSLSREILSITGMTIRETGVPMNGARFEITVPPQTYRFQGR